MEGLGTDSCSILRQLARNHDARSYYVDDVRVLLFIPTLQRQIASANAHVIDTCQSVQSYVVMEWRSSSATSPNAVSF